MHVLVTAGNTQTPIDRVRCLTNLFTGRTGSRIARTAHERGHAVVLLTSHPDLVGDVPVTPGVAAPIWRVRPYGTFEDLQRLMEEEVPQGGYDAIIHAAAVSDYASAGTFTPAPGTAFDPHLHTWSASRGTPQLVDVAQGKVRSSHEEVWLRLTPTPKLVDRIRSDWAFRGVLVKFKLEVGLTDTELLAAAERACMQSDADLMVANTLEGMGDWAYIGGPQRPYQRVSRSTLPSDLLQFVEALAQRQRES